MSKTARIEARIDHDLKQAAEAIFVQLGISPSEAIRIFYKQVEIHNGFPFEVRLPNAETIAAIEEAQRHPECLIHHHNAEEMFGPRSWHRPPVGARRAVPFLLGHVRPPEEGTARRAPTSKRLASQIGHLADRVIKTDV